MKRILLFTMMASFGAFAADKVWTNETGDGKWGTDGNWSDNVAPTASDTGYTITVSGTSDNNVVGLAPTRLILTGSSAVRVTGESITLTDGVQFDATADGTLVLPLVLSGSGQQPFGGSSAKTLYLMGAVSGSGGIEQTEYFTLSIQAVNTFTGGFKQTKGQVSIKTGSAFGTGSVVFTGPQKVGTAYVIPFVVAAVNLTIANDIKFARDGYGSGEGHAGSVSIAAGTKFTGTCDFSAGGTRLQKNMSNNGTITFSGPVKLYQSSENGGYKTTFLPKIGSACPFLFNGKMTGGGKVYQDSGSSLLQFAAAGNEVLMHWLQGASMTIECKIADAFLPTTLVMFDGNASRTGQLFNLGGFDQTVNAVYDKDASVSYSHTVKGGGTARLTMKATADRAYGGQFTDDLTICWAPAAAKTYTLTRTAFSTSGGLVVSNGTVTLTSGASFPNASRLEVATGATFTMATGTSFNKSAQRLDLGTGATFNLADGVELAFEAAYMDGVRLAGGVTYSAANPIPGVTISGNGTISVPLAPVPAGRSATWSGGGGANVRTDESTNWDGNSTPTLNDGLTAVTFATGGTEAAVTGPAYVNGVLFNAPGAFTLRSLDGNAVVRLQGGGIDTASPASGTRTYTVSSPLCADVDQVWDVAANTTLSVTGRLTGEMPASVLLRTGTGTVKLNGTDDYTGFLVLSNGVTEISGDGLGHTNRGSVIISDWPQGNTRVKFTDATVSKPVLFNLDSRTGVYGYNQLLSFNGTTRFKSPIALSGNYVRFTGATGQTCYFEGGMEMASGAVRYPVITGKGTFIITNTPVNVTAWWMENANSVFAVAGNRFENNGIRLSNTATLRIAVDNAVAACLQLNISGTTRLDLDGHDLYVGSLCDLAEASAGTPVVTSAAPAKVEFDIPSGSPRSWLTFTDAAGLRKKGSGNLVLCRASTTTGTLEVVAGTVTLKAGAWASGREVVIGATGVLGVESTSALAREAAVRVTTGGRINLSEGAIPHVAELWIDGVQKNPGASTAATVPAVFVGAGTLIVGNVGTMVIFR